MADDGPRNGGGPSTGTDSVALREYLMALIHALDVRLSGALEARTKLADERFSTERAQTKDQFADVEQRGLDRMGYIDTRARERMESSQRALDKVEASNEKRFESMNEFRGQLKDQAAHFVTRNEMDAKVAGWSDRVDRSERQADDRLKILEAKGSNLDGRFWALGVGLGFLVFVINIAFHFLGVTK